MCVYRGIWFLHFYCLPHLVLRGNELDFHGGPAVKNLPASPRAMDSIPGLGGVHVPWGNKADVPQLLSPLKRSHRDEKPVHRSWKGAPLSAPGESPCTQQWRPSAAKKQFFSKKMDKTISVWLTHIMKHESWPKQMFNKSLWVKAWIFHSSVCMVGPCGSLINNAWWEHF